MKRICLVMLIVIFSINTVKSDNWMTSFEDSKKLAIASNKLVLVDFWASWCGPCKKMDKESWSVNEVKLLMENYVPVKIDIDANKNLAKKYGVKGIPYIFIMDGNGKVIYNEMSYKNKNELIVLLKKYALNTSFLSRDLINYYKKSNFNTSFRLASKYQDYAIYVDMSIRRDLLNLSKDYFNDAKKYLRNSELENKKAFLQIIDLFNIQVKLISNNPEKALNLLQKLDRDKIDKINKTFYSFLNYTAYKQLNDIENVSFWEKELLDRDIKKANLIIKNNS